MFDYEDQRFSPVKHLWMLYVLLRFHSKNSDILAQDRHMSAVCGMLGGEESAYRVLAGRLQGIEVRRPRCRWEDAITMNAK
jgi:hypothetical protein